MYDDVVEYFLITYIEDTRFPREIENIKHSRDKQGNGLFSPLFRSADRSVK
jgi:hypothetical protein